MTSPTGAGMRGWWHVTVKELRETLRDPHVVVFLGFPLVFYPLLLWGSLQLAMLHEAWQERQAVVIDVAGPEPLRDALLEAPAREGTGGLDALAAGDVDVVVETHTSGVRWDVTVHGASARPASRRAVALVEARLAALRAHRLDALVGEHGLTADDLSPLPVTDEAIGSSEALLGSMLATLFAFLAPFSMLLAGIYPAVELVVSERERGTLETTLATPVSRGVILGGKLGACVFLMLVAAIGNLGALALTLAQLQVSVGGLGALVLPSPLQLLWATPTLVATAILCAAALMLSMLPARTFKEGELTGSVVLIAGGVPVLVALIGLMAGEVGPAMRWVPVGNASVVLHAALTDSLTPGLALLPAVENAVLGLGLLALGASVAGREDYLVGGRLPRWLAWMHRGEPS